MASNNRTTNAAPEAEAPVELAKTESTIPFAGPALLPGQTAQEINLAHHLAIGGTDYEPGSRIRVSPDYAQRLRGNGYAARESRR